MPEGMDQLKRGMNDRVTNDPARPWANTSRKQAREAVAISDAVPRNTHPSVSHESAEGRGHDMPDAARHPVSPSGD